MNKPKLLVVEDDQGLARQYRWAFPDNEVLIAASRKDACHLASRELPPVAIVDLGLPPDADGASEGLALLPELLSIVPDAKLVVATGSDDINHALQAISSGAFDFYQKPVDVEVLKVIVNRAYSLYGLEAENRRLRTHVGASPISRIITADPDMLRLCRSIEKLASTDVIVLILGESGTGKELLAHALHGLGPRRDKPIVAINCAAIPENLLESELFGHERGAFTGAVRQTIGKVEAAHRGTLFLDEIGDLPQPLQVKLLRFLQDQVIERVGGRRPIQVDVRIVCATNQNLQSKMQQGEFREDLFYRLNEVSLSVPPLRDRAGDAVLLANVFLRRFAGEFRRQIRGFSAAAVSAIAGFKWPGNVRELENRVKRAVVMSEGRVIEPADLQFAVDDTGGHNLDIRAARTKAEREVIQLALAQSNGVISTAAKLLGVSRPTLYDLLQEHALSPNPLADERAAPEPAQKHALSGRTP